MDQELAQFRQVQRLDCAVDNYSEIGGLRLVPIALFSLLIASFLGGVLTLPTDWMVLVSGLGLHATVVGYWLIARWYRDNYGMTQQAWPGSTRALVSQLAVWAAISLLVLAGIDDLIAVMEVLGYLTGVAALAWIFVHWKRKGEIWPQGYALMMMGAIGVILHQVPFPKEDGLYGLLLAFMGMTLLVASASGHDRLRKEKKMLEEDEDE